MGVIMPMVMWVVITLIAAMIIVGVIMPMTTAAMIKVLVMIISRDMIMVIARKVIMEMIGTCRKCAHWEVDMVGNPMAS
jgi:hypothetical protein